MKKIYRTKMKKAVLAFALLGILLCSVVVVTSKSGTLCYAEEAASEVEKSGTEISTEEESGTEVSTETEKSTGTETATGETTETGTETTTGTEATTEMETGREATTEEETEIDATTEVETGSETATEASTESESEEPKEISLSACTITLSKSSYTYNGSAKKPSITVTNGSDTLVKDTDYTVSYSNNTNAGTATVTIKAAGVVGTGNCIYTGTVTKQFTIKKATQTVTLSKSSISVKMGKTATISASTNGDGKLKYSSADKTIATVSSSGVITPKGVGKVKITVYAAAGSNYAKSESKTITVTVGLSAPAISKVANTTSGIKVTWKKVTGANGYYIYRATSKSGTYTKVGTVKSGTTLTFTNKTSGDYKISANKTYYYKVVAYSGSTKSAKSSASSAIKFLTAKVSGLTNTSKGITVKWSKVSGAKGYYIYRKTGSEGYDKVGTITGASTVSYSDTSVKSKNGTTYTYYVVPYYTSGSSKIAGTHSNTVKTVRLTAPTSVSLKSASVGKLAISWTKNSKASGYQIQYSTDKSFSGSKTTSVYVKSASTVSKTISKLTSGSTYYVRIRAYKTVSSKKYYSAWSSTKSKVICGWKTSSGKSYYYGTDGKKVTGWKKIDGYYYYFNSSGVLQTNQIVGSSSAGYYYVDEDGIRITSSEITSAVKFVVANTNSSQTKSEKLKACFNALCKYSYKRNYATPTASDLSAYAVEMFKNKAGNCYRFAASFVCVARVLGYDARIGVGNIESSTGGWAAHGWAEIYVDGTWYICDLSMHRSSTQNYYMRTTANAPRKYKADAKYVLTFEGSKAIWR